MQVDGYTLTTGDDTDYYSGRNPKSWTLKGKLTSYTKLGETAVSEWALAPKSDYEAIFQNLGSKKNDNGYTYDANVNAYLTTGVGGTEIYMYQKYWSSTWWDPEIGLWMWAFSNYRWRYRNNDEIHNVRPVLGF